MISRIIAMISICAVVTTVAAHADALSSRERQIQSLVDSATVKESAAPTPGAVDAAESVRVLTTPKSAKPAAAKFYMPSLSKEDQKLKGVKKSIDGILSAIGPLGIAVSHDRDLKTGTEKEMWFDFHSDLKFVGVKSMSEFREGDAVSVAYLQWVKKEQKNGQEVIAGAKRIIQELKLIRRAPPAVEETSVDESQTGVPQA